ncbi:DUF4442 domain-containing protein [Hydrogenophilus thiooxidans]|uniref:DUF4442 domain-containing protein n=1 Tax=Hydrogenophilus thiooxidans TaxID=2820326 RepID=UPI001C21C1BD|nr:DUF4442 domain-containing protein [Hydrogenophilus thiooxidans]
MRSPLMRHIPRRYWHHVLRWGFNFYPSYRTIGARVERIDPDLRRIVVRLPHTWRTRNPAGATFGGALYAAADPMFAVMLAYNLPERTVVWDKAASIRYRRPGRTTLWAEFVLPEAVLESVAHELVTVGRSEPTFVAVWRDEEGLEYTTVEKTVFVATPEYMRARQSA